MLNAFTQDPILQTIAGKVIASERIKASEGLYLYENAPLGWLGLLAGLVRKKLNGDITWYNHNFHIEPTNRCIYNCRFCSYNERNSKQSWDYDLPSMVELARKAPAGISEIHIVGGVAPERGTAYYADLLAAIRSARPEVHLKAFSAIEISYMARKDGITLQQCLTSLKEAGLGSIPGGGAEIFAPEVRERICPEKDDAERWLEVHHTAHTLGIPSNATMLYGHVETYAHRIDHLSQLRELQDQTHGFNAFIPLKFKNANNPLSHVREVAVTEDLRNYAVSRVFLDNFPHLKAYWPMTGRGIAQVAQNFGVDDLDGTIQDSTKIYSEAGAEEQNPSMDEESIRRLISDAGFTPAERDSLYHPL